MTLGTALVQALPWLLYLLIGAVVGNALAYQIDDEPSSGAGRLLKAGAFLFGLLCWPLVLLYGLAQLLRALTYSGPF